MCKREVKDNVGMTMVKKNRDKMIILIIRGLM